MKAETAERCIMECHRFIKAWDACILKHRKTVARFEEHYRDHVEKDGLQFNGDIGRERAALRRASLDLSNALADLRQGR